VAVVDVDGFPHLRVAHVGDSRAYLIHNRGLTRLTDDHTVVAALVRRGELDSAAVAQHPYHGVLTRVLGMGPSVEPDTTSFAHHDGDRVLLCTDGLTNELDDHEIAAVIADATRGRAVDDHRAIVDALVEAALARGGRDDVSVAVVEVVRAREPVGTR
jgi:protein phosphatase